MSEFFKSLFDKKRSNQKLELISIHIPKTAGTSFRNILKEVYGENGVVRLDIPLYSQLVKINEQAYSSTKLPFGTRVVHGHFSLEQLKENFEIIDSVPIITWLRHPVDRVISNYYYLEKRLKEELQEEAKGLNILSKMQRSLPEYARDEINRNRQYKFLNGIDLEDFSFVGIQEHFSEDLISLSKQLDWPVYEELKHNITGSKYQVSAEDRAEIAELNTKDMDLYEKAIELRKKRMT